jgi:hypothetical protein
MTDSLPTKSHLERLITRHAIDEPGTVARTRRWISTMAIVQALQRAHDDEVDSLFVLKGGTAIELRLQHGARMTRDVDATFHGTRRQLERVLEQAFAAPVSGFTITSSKPEPIGQTNAVRVTCKLAYRSRPWGTIDLELAIDDRPPEFEFVPAFDLATFGLEGPERIHALPAHTQIAQKLHAVSERFDHGDNQRVRDVIDILLLRAFAVDLALLRTTCVDVFDRRAKHAWPPTITVYDPWALEHARLCETINATPTDIIAAVEEIHDFIRAIDRAHR